MQPHGLVDGNQIKISGLIAPNTALNGNTYYVEVSGLSDPTTQFSLYQSYIGGVFSMPVAAGGAYMQPTGPNPYISTRTTPLGKFANCATDIQSITGDEIDVETDYLTTVSKRTGLQIVLKPSSAARPATLGGITPTDEAINISAAAGTPDSWTHGLTFGSFSSGWPFANDSVLVWAASTQTSMPALNFADLSAVKFSGQIEKFPNYSLWTLHRNGTGSGTFRLTADGAVASATNTLNVTAGKILTGVDQCSLQAVRTDASGYAAWTSTFAFAQPTTSSSIALIGTTPSWTQVPGVTPPTTLGTPTIAADTTVNNGINISGLVNTGTCYFAATCFQNVVTM